MQFKANEKKDQIEVDCIKYGEEEELIDGCCPNHVYELISYLN